jgi:hypothetical protein
MKKTLVALAFGLIAATSASASVMHYENRATDSGVNTNNYQSSWNNQTSSIYNTNITSFDRLRANGSNRNQHSHLNISFDVSSASSGLDWWFQFSPDAGLGAEIYFDGNLVERTNDNLWWGYNWNRESELVEALIGDLDSGSHTLDLFWAENCCNGGQSGRFSVDNGHSWLALTTDNLDAIGVTEPGPIGLMALGIAGLILSRRQANKK